MFLLELHETITEVEGGLWGGVYVGFGEELFCGELFEDVGGGGFSGGGTVVAGLMGLDGAFFLEEDPGGLGVGRVGFGFRGGEGGGVGGAPAGFIGRQGEAGAHSPFLCNASRRGSNQHSP